MLPLIRHIIRRYTLCPHERDDIGQEVALAMLSVTIDPAKGPTKLAATIANRKCRDHLRSKSRRAKWERLAATNRPEAVSPEYDDRPPVPPVSELFRLYAVHELTAAEIARSLGLTRECVNMRIHRERARLKGTQ